MVVSVWTRLCDPSAVSSPGTALLGWIFPKRSPFARVGCDLTADSWASGLDSRRVYVKRQSHVDGDDSG